MDIGWNAWGKIVTHGKTSNIVKSAATPLTPLPDDTIINTDISAVGSTDVSDTSAHN